jgi:hypothetical protein
MSCDSDSGLTAEDIATLRGMESAQTGGRSPAGYQRYL